MIMGMSGTALHWGEPFLEALRPHFEVIVYDHRGVGASSRLEGPLTITQLARDAAGLLDALAIEAAHVLGISMGGMVAQELALARAELVRTLTLGCTFCGGADSVATSPAVLGRLAAAMQSGDRARAVRTAWEVNVSQAMLANGDACERFTGIVARRPVAAPVIMAQLQACVAHDTCARLPTLTVPTLVKPFVSAPHAWTLAQDPNDVWTEYICSANEEPDVYKNLDQKTKEEYEKSGRDAATQSGRQGGRGR